MISTCPPQYAKSAPEYEKWELREKSRLAAIEAAKPPAPPPEMVTVKLTCSRAGPMQAWKEGAEVLWRADEARKMMAAGEATPVCPRAKEIFASLNGSVAVASR
jgi:hypothetical protein